jgi:16S rRNA (cytosine1402-N4)-methyltransferase
MSDFHTPVLVEQSIRFLDPRKGGVYVDATLGGGGHSLALLKAEPEITLYGFDQDAEAVSEARNALAEYSGRCNLIHSNFSDVRTELALRRVKAIDGILFDLGVSSHQLDTPGRGFSFDREGPLDLRMDASLKQSATDVVNELDQKQLAGIFRDLGEELNSGRIAAAIVRSRNEGRIETTGQLARAIERAVGTGTRDSLKSKARVFQALRIHVNRELEVLPQALKDAINILKPGGRIVVLSYHSLEDRVVKTVFKNVATGCKCPPNVLKCVCGEKPLLKLLTKSPVSADQEETAQNNRSRSAKLRAAEKLMGES